MKRLLKSAAFLFRGENGKILKIKTAFILAGIASTIWFLIRVIPKPQRALYPCMQAAAPVMSSFVIWALSVLGMMAAWRKAKVSFIHSKYLYTSLFGFVFLIFLASFIYQNSDRVSAMFLSDAVEVNAPIGTGKGIFPGRVVWVYNPNAAKWTGSGLYWAAAVNPQAEYNKSFTAGINSLSGGSNDAESWDKIFKWFNDNHSRPGTGYQAGDMIAIKINQNNSASSSANAGNTSNANPQSCVACVQSLVNAGVPEADIWIGDPSRAVTDNIFNAIHSAFPGVNVVDYFGNNGRVKSGVVTNVFPNNDVVKNQSTCFYNARYIVNMPLFKGHEGQGITFGSKNYYGINGIKPVWSDNGGKHPSVSALTNYMTNANFGGKTILWVMDAMYPNKQLGGTPDTKWNEAPFNGRPASSFIMSLDGVAEESVSLDFFNQHYASIISSNGGLSNAEGYLHNAANAKVGVHEHWNNSKDRQYSKNINPEATEGIELVYVQVISTEISMKSDDLDKFGITLYSRGDGFIQLNTRKNLTASLLNLELFNLQGASVFKTTTNSDRNAINVNHLDEGFYLYRLSGQDKLYSGKFIYSK